MAENGDTGFDRAAARAEGRKNFEEKHGKRPSQSGWEDVGEFFTAYQYDTDQDIYDDKKSAYLKSYIQQAQAKHKYGDMNLSDKMDPSKMMGQDRFDANQSALAMLAGLAQEDPAQWRAERQREIMDTASGAALAEQQRMQMSGFVPGSAAGQQALMAPAQAQLQTGMATLESDLLKEQVTAAVAISDGIARNNDDRMKMLGFNDDVIANVNNTMRQVIQDYASAGMLDDPAVNEMINVQYDEFLFNVFEREPPMDPQEAADIFQRNSLFLHSK